jgi:hypothetical protein
MKILKGIKKFIMLAKFVLDLFPLTPYLLPLLVICPISCCLMAVSVQGLLLSSFL